MGLAGDRLRVTIRVKVGVRVGVQISPPTIKPITILIPLGPQVENKATAAGIVRYRLEYRLEYRYPKTQVYAGQGAWLG